MTLSWAEPAQTVLAQAVPDLAGLWSALYAAQNAALWLAHADPAVGDPRCSEAAADLGALAELEWAQPAGAVVDLGPVPHLSFADCLADTVELLRGIVMLAARAVRVGDDLAVPELVAVSRSVHLVATAHLRLTGQRP